MDIKDEIRKLIQLQEIDLEILSLKREKDQEKPAIIEKLTNEFEAKKSSLQGAEQEHKDAQKKKKEKELDLASKEEAVRKSQGQLYQLKTNQEYDAKLKEINSLKSDVSVIEEDMLKIMDQIDQIKQRVEEQKQGITQLEKDYKEKKDKVEKEIKEIEAKIDVLTGKRKVFEKDISPNVLSKYEYILNNKQGLAIVPLRNGSCGGCFLNLPPEVTNKVKQYSELIQCEMCARILYLDDDFEL